MFDLDVIGLKQERTSVQGFTSGSMSIRFPLGALLPVQIGLHGHALLTNSLCRIVLTKL